MSDVARSSYIAYLLVSIFAAIVSFYKLGLLASFLSPEEFGKYSLSIISLVYVTTIGGLGANEYMLKFGAVTSKGVSRDAYVVRNNALLYGAIPVVFVSLLLLLLSSYLVYDSFGQVLMFVALLSVLSFPYNIYESFYRAKGLKMRFSAMLLLKTSIVTAIIILADELTSYRIAMFSEMASYFLIVIFMLVISIKTIFVYGFDKPVVAVGVMVKNGYCWSLSNLLRNASVSIDRYLVSVFLGFKYLGVYSFVMIAYQGIVLIGGIVMNVLGPYILKNYTGDGKNEEIRKIFVLCPLLFLAVSFVLLPVVSFFVSFALDRFYVEYKMDNILLMFSLVYVASVFTFGMYFLDLFFIVNSREVFITKISVGVLVLTLALMQVCVAFQVSLVFYIFVFAAVRLMAFFLMYYFVFNNRLISVF